MLASICASRRSVAAALMRAASALSQQHQLRRGRDAQNERDRAGLRISVAAATPSQLRRSSAARNMSGRRGFWAYGFGQSSPSGKFATFGGDTTTTIKPSFSELILIFLQSLGHSPDRRKKKWGRVKKSCVCVWVRVVTHRIV